MHPGHRCIKGVGESSGSWLRYQGTYWVVGLSVCGPLISSSAVHLIDNFCYFFVLFPRLLYFLSYKIVADLIKTLFRRPEVANERSNNDLILLPTFRLSRANFHRPIYLYQFTCKEHIGKVDKKGWKWSNWLSLFCLICTTLTSIVVMFNELLIIKLLKFRRRDILFWNCYHYY